MRVLILNAARDNDQDVSYVDHECGQIWLIRAVLVIVEVGRVVQCHVLDVV